MKPTYSVALNIGVKEPTLGASVFIVLQILNLQAYMILQANDTKL